MPSNRQNNVIRAWVTLVAETDALKQERRPWRSPLYNRTYEIADAARTAALGAATPHRGPTSKPKAYRRVFEMVMRTRFPNAVLVPYRFKKAVPRPKSG